MFFYTCPKTKNLKRLLTNPTAHPKELDIYPMMTASTHTLNEHIANETHQLIHPSAAHTYHFRRLHPRHKYKEEAKTYPNSIIM